MATSILKSKGVLRFSENPKEVYKEDLAEARKKDNKIPMVQAIYFKDGVSVIESVAKTIYETMKEEYASHPDTFRGVPVHPDPPNIYARTYARHSEIHAATMKGLEGQQALFDMIMEDAGEKGLDVEGEKTKGETYARNMLGEYFGKIMDEFKNIGPYTWEKNPIVVKFVEIWGKEFEKLSYTAQVAATLAFLNTNRELTSNHPPYGTNEKLLPLLHGDIMEAYNILYNKAKTLKELDV